MRADKTFDSLLSLWLNPQPNTSPPAALAGAALAFAEKLPQLSIEYKVLKFVARECAYACSDVSDKRRAYGNLTKLLTKPI